MWLSTIFGSAPDSQSGELLPRLAVLLVCLGALLASRKRLPELLGRVGIVGMLLLTWPLLSGAATATPKVDMGVLVAGAVGASWRWFLPVKLDWKSIFGGYFIGVSAAHYATPATLALASGKVPDIAAGLVAVGWGALGLEMARVLAEKLPSMIGKRIGAADLPKKETSDDV